MCTYWVFAGLAGPVLWTWSWVSWPPGGVAASRTENGDTSPQQCTQFVPPLMRLGAIMTCDRLSWGVTWELKSSVFVCLCSGSSGQVMDSKTSDISHPVEPVSTQKVKAECSWSFSRTRVPWSLPHITPLFSWIRTSMPLWCTHRAQEQRTVYIVHAGLSLVGLDDVRVLSYNATGGPHQSALGCDELILTASASQGHWG